MWHFHVTSQFIGTVMFSHTLEQICERLFMIVSPKPSTTRRLSLQCRTLVPHNILDRYKRWYVALWGVLVCVCVCVSSLRLDWHLLSHKLTTKPMLARDLAARQRAQNPNPLPRPNRLAARRLWTNICLRVCVCAHIQNRTCPSQRFDSERLHIFPILAVRSNQHKHTPARKW